MSSLLIFDLLITLVPLVPVFFVWRQSRAMTDLSKTREVIFAGALICAVLFSVLLIGCWIAESVGLLSEIAFWIALLTLIGGTFGRGTSRLLLKLAAVLDLVVWYVELLSNGV